MDERRDALFISFRRRLPWWWWLVFLVAFISVEVDVVYGVDGGGICNVKGCKCVDRPGGWKVVNCTFEANQDVTFDTDSIDQKSTEIFINGGNTVMFKEKSMNALHALSILYINNSNKILVKTHAFYNSSSPSLRFDVENCDSLLVETEAFVNSESTVFIDVNRAQYCIIFAAAFSKLLNATFQNIKQMDLVERTFEIIKKDGFVRYGPLTKITFNKVRISKIPSKTFFSSLNEIRIQDSVINEIQEDAFSATQISTVHLSNSTVNYIKSEAFPSSSLIQNFKIIKCKIVKIESKAVMCAISNLSIENSSIQDIETGAINTTSATVNIIGNEIVNFKQSALTFESWNKIVFEQNMVKNFGSHAIYGEPTQQLKTEFQLINNDIFNLDNSSLAIVSTLQQDSVTIRDNYFNVKCHCFLDQWLGNLTQSTKGIDNIMESSFCTIDDLLARCYELKTGSINMLNFTEMVCQPGNTITCSHYNGEEKVLNITNPVFLDAPKSDNSWLVLTLTIAGLVVITLVATFVLLLISGGRWLKRKGYFRNMHYSPNETSNDEENTIVTIDQDSEDHKRELPEELTLEYLEYLKQRLDDPTTHQETSEMIERLYEMFIIEDNYENNNRQQQDEEAHLYEELANMQTPKVETPQNGPLSILRIMEERFNLQFIDEEHKAAKLVNEYSEPSDAAVHLYSELKQNQQQNDKNENNDITSMASRPLPHKPDFYKAGPSSLD